MSSHFIRMKRDFIPLFVHAAIISTLLLGSCEKVRDVPQNANAFHSSEVAEEWMKLQIRLMRNSTGIPNQAFSRHYVYAGIAAYESISPSLPGAIVNRAKWNGLTGLPASNPKLKYYWPASMNAALASINRSMFPNANVTDKAAIDSLENALNSSFSAEAENDRIVSANNFGKQVAAAIYNWAETDGYKTSGGAYTPPTGPGLWVPTPPAYANAASPYWGNNRPVVRGSIMNSMPDAPIAYSADPGSPFYQMVKQVYDASQVLTQEQKNMAMYWRDVPGVTSPGHWLSILYQVVSAGDVSLEKAALAYALTGAAINDGLIACWQAKYHFNLVRPITYIRNVIGASEWLSFLTTPGHPEYPSAHAVLSAAAADVFTHLFGNKSFTDHTYDYLGYPARNYNSFKAIGEDASYSRFYAGIHYLPSIEAGIKQGRKITENIFSEIKDYDQSPDGFEK
ncbi:MAG TPA: vanadium-dependent haloperoxidase [Chitinophagaceae bacterium]